MPGVVIAIDGPAASGKGTLAKRVAEHYRVPCLDTGLLYRAVARDVLAAGNDLADAAAAVACAKALDPATFDDPALRGASAGDAASVVARIPEVRAALLDYQRTFAKSSMGAVLDGRDIGTVVCPEAPVKIYVTASAQERARRRYAELENRGEGIRFQDVLEDIHRRDARDTGRAVAPLLPAKDAFQLDTTYMNIEQAFAAAVDIIESRLAGARPPPAVGATEA
ncbi:MAG TPA: (d)CMP kinase [Hyphomicrobium sp.]|nr:(d)CMP kinase [Hyphomicrobium sp.]